MRCEERFYKIYGKDPVDISFCPYRICPIGAHSDHNLGKVTGLAIDKGIHIAYKPKMNGVVEMCSLQFPKRAQWHIREIGEKTGDWADYLRGATWALSNRFGQLEISRRFRFSAWLRQAYRLGRMNHAALDAIDLPHSLNIGHLLDVDQILQRRAPTQADAVPAP